MYRSTNLLAVVLVWLVIATKGVAAPSKTAASRLEVHPSKVLIHSRRGRVQLVVTQWQGDKTLDVTRRCKIIVRDKTKCDVTKSRVTPKSNGATELVVAFGKQKVTVPVLIQGQDKPDPIRFQYETLAVITKQGCNSGSCHGSPRGRGGFSLSLFAYDTVNDLRVLSRGGFNRRTNVLDPDASLMLKKPLLRIPHVGGKRIRKDDLAYSVLRQWIYEGARGDPPKSPTCDKIVLYPQPQRVLHLPLGKQNEPADEAKRPRQQLSVFAHFSDGTVRDVTDLAKFSTSDDDIAEVDTGGLVSGVRRGQAAVTVRYLEHLESSYFTVVADVPGYRWTNPPTGNYIDRLVHAKLRQLKYLPSGICSDEVFLRRVHLDLTGLLPSVQQARSFLADKDQRKRAKLIDRLLACDEFSRFWSLRIADLMKVQPKVLKGDRAVLFANWIRDAIQQNVPVDQFVRRILTSGGDTQKNPAANYFLAAKTTQELTETTAQLFMGSRIQCAKCHNHPFENWTQRDYYRIGAVFHRIRRKGNNITVAATGEMKHPSTGQVMKPWGQQAEVSDKDRRVAFASWLTDKQNPLFAKVEVNRSWAHLIGKGIVEPVDDFRSSNPPANLELLQALANDFRQSGYNRKHLIRVICNSHTYQRSTKSNKFNQDEERLFSKARIRLLTAEQLKDAVGYVTASLPLSSETQKQQRQLANELAKLVAKKKKTKADSKKINSLRGQLKSLDQRMQYATQRAYPEQSPFLRAFGQPTRTSPCACDRSSEPTLNQALQMLNGKHVFDQINRSVNRYNKIKQNDKLVEELYLAALSRMPRVNERQRVRAFLAKAKDRAAAIRDLVWVIVNTQEFMFQH